MISSLMDCLIHVKEPQHDHKAQKQMEEQESAKRKTGPCLVNIAGQCLNRTKM